jgi:adenosylmethionine-8-amino-7-oxononanoate aminotransferase
VARGPVARLVAAGARNTHEWTPGKRSLLAAFDESGITAVFMDPAQGGSFGLAVHTKGDVSTFAAVDDNQNILLIWTLQQP